MAAFDESRLDDPHVRAEVDTTDLVRAFATAGAQVRRAVLAAAESGVAGGRVTGGDRPRAVHLAAAGATGAVAGVLRVLLAGSGPVPLSTAAGRSLPGWVGPLDLVVVADLAGDTAGPLHQAHEAGRRGAHVVTVGAPDGALADAAAAAHGVHVPVDPPGVHDARAALWSLATPVVLAAVDAGVVELPGTVLDAVADRLDAQAEAHRPDAESFVNPAKSLAADLAPLAPFVIGDGAVTGAAARRAAAMLTRTAGVPTRWGRLPDAVDGVLAALVGPLGAGGGTAPDGGRDIFADPYVDAPGGTSLGLVLLRDPVPDAEGDERELERHNLAQALRDRADASGARVVELTAAPGHPLERLAELVALTDLAAVYLAVGHGMDPGAAPPPLR